MFENGKEIATVMWMLGPFSLNCNNIWGYLVLEKWRRIAIQYKPYNAAALYGFAKLNSQSVWIPLWSNFENRCSL